MSYRGAHRQSGIAPLTRILAGAAATATALVATGAVFAAAPSSAEGPYVAEGSVKRASAGFGATDTEFTATCPAMPSSQGEDGWVFELPAAVSVKDAVVRVAGPSTHTIRAYVYDDDCTFKTVVDTDSGTGWAHTLGGTERFFSVFTNTVSTMTSVPITLTAGPAAGGGSSSASPSATASASPSATASASPSAAPTSGTTTRGTYPVTPSDPLFLQNGANDPFLSGQWGMRTVHAPQAWQQPRSTGAGIKVAVIDSGLDLTHPDFACPGKLLVVPGSDPDPDNSDLPTDNNGHGTHVAGIVGACTNNGTGVVGVAPDSIIMPIQGLSDATPAEQNVSQMAGAIDTATNNGAHVINMSLGFGATGHVGTAAFITSSTYAPIEAAIARAVAAGVVVVAAAGNDTSPLCGFPAIAEDVICVGSSDKRDLNSWFGNFPVKLDNEDDVGPALLAPGGAGEQAFCDISGEDVLSTWAVEIDKTEGDCDGLEGYKTIEGTSMASPHVAGVAALVYDRIGGARSSANGQKVVDALLGSAVDLYGPGYDPASGYGRVDALAAVSYFEAAVDPTPTARTTQVRFSSTVPSSAQYSDSATLSATLTDADGRPIANESLTFQLLGRDGFRETSATTDGAGVASTTLVVDAPPGSYDVLVGYAGKKDTWTTSAAGQPFTINRENTATTLTASGSGSKRTLTATVVDGDDAARKVAGVVVSFFADGKKLGDAITSSSGVATFTPGSGARGTSTRYEASYAGDGFFLPSTAVA